MKRFLIPIVVILISLQTEAQQKKNSDVKWISFEEAVMLNKKNPKPLLIDVYTDWCGWCKKMDKTTYKNNVIVNYINNNFYAVKLDGEGKKDIKYKDHTFKFRQQGRTKYNEFAAALLNGKLSYPTTVFMNEKLELLDRVPGYLDTKLMEKVLTFFATEKYKSTKWEDFVKGFKSSL